jgi:radical SAM protein
VTPSAPPQPAIPRAPASPRVYWEITRACDLACRHCRAEANAARDPRELTTAEGRRLLDALRGFGPAGAPVILTGGDPFKRPDFWELLEHGAALGLDLSVAPSGTPALTAAAIERLKESRVQAISLSLDGSTSGRHDGLRGVAGCFTRTLEGARTAVASDLGLQINTLVTAETVDDLAAIGERVTALGAGRWSLFFLIHVGRGRVLQPLGPERCEKLLAALWERAQSAPFTITTTEAPHYRRLALQRMRVDGWTSEAVRRHPVRRSFGIRDGNGIMFVSHTGDVSPSGFLPLVVGNVRTASPVDLYRDAPLFRRLRQPDGFGGRCGRCEFRAICGGSRARAFAASGDPLAADLLCPYEPGSLIAPALPS